LYQLLIQHSLKLAVLLAIVLASFYSGILNLSINDLTNLSFVGAQFASESLIDTMLASLATVIAIYFSISILAVQYAASNYTPSILEYYKRDVSSWITYLFLFVPLCISAYMSSQKASILLLNSGHSISLLDFSTVMLISSFPILALQFVHIFDLVNPKAIITIAEQQCVHDIRKVPSRLNVIIRHARPMLAQLPFFGDFTFHQEQQRMLTTANNKILHIADIVYKSALKRETETYAFGLSALSEIAETYVSVRKDFWTPNDSFLERIYATLIDMSKAAFDNEDLSLLGEIVRGLERVGIAAIGIRAVSRGPDQIATLAMVHIHDLGVKATQRELWDGVARCVWSIENIGTVAIQKTGDESLATREISSLGGIAIGKRNWYLTYVTLVTLNNLLFQSVQAMAPIFQGPFGILEAIEQLGTMALERRLDEQALFSIFPVLFQNSLGRTVYAALNVKNEEHPLIETAAREEYAKQTVSRLLESISEIGLAASKTQYSLTLHYVIDCLGGITELLCKEKFVTIKTGFREELLEVISVAGRLYFIRTENVHPWFVWGGEEVLTDLAFRALDLGQDEIALACVKSILDVSTKLIVIDKYGYDAPRLASRAAVIGVYAQHKSNKIVAKQCTTDLAVFDRKYMKHSPNPHAMLHIKTMRGAYEKSKEDWRRDKKWEEAFRQVTENEVKDYETLLKSAKSSKR
jgi:hypothetical protein